MRVQREPPEDEGFAPGGLRPSNSDRRKSERLPERVGVEASAAPGLQHRLAVCLGCVGHVFDQMSAEVPALRVEVDRRLHDRRDVW